MLDRWRVAARVRLREDDGATAVEYAIMASAIAAVIVVIVMAVGLQTQGMFQGTATALGKLVGL